jgi:hypothetical protein
MKPTRGNLEALAKAYNMKVIRRKKQKPKEPSRG